MSGFYVRFVGDEPRSEFDVTGRGDRWWPGEVRAIGRAIALQLVGARKGWEAEREQVGAELIGGIVKTVAASRDLTAADNGATLECSATVTLTVPAGLPPGFSCSVLASGTTSVASSGGTLLNGATSTLTRAAASNTAFAILGRASAVDSYAVTGS